MHDNGKKGITRRKFFGVPSAAAVGVLVSGLFAGGIADYIGGRTLAPSKETTITQNVTTTLSPITVTSTVTGPTTVHFSTVTTCSTSMPSAGKDRIPPGGSMR